MVSAERGKICRNYHRIIARLYTADLRTYRPIVRIIGESVFVLVKRCSDCPIFFRGQI